MTEGSVKVCFFIIALLFTQVSLAIDENTSNDWKETCQQIDKTLQQQLKLNIVLSKKLTHINATETDKKVLMALNQSYKKALYQAKKSIRSLKITLLSCQQLKVKMDENKLQN